MSTVLASRLSAGLALCCLGFALAIPCALPAQEPAAAPGVKYTVLGQADRLTMTVNTSRILEFPFDVPKVMVNNKDLVTLIPLTARSIQVSAVKQGTTQLNVWSSDDK